MVLKAQGNRPAEQETRDTLRPLRVARLPCLYTHSAAVAKGVKFALDFVSVCLKGKRSIINGEECNSTGFAPDTASAHNPQSQVRCSRGSTPQLIPGLSNRY